MTKVTVTLIRLILVIFWKLRDTREVRRYYTQTNTLLKDYFINSSELKVLSIRKQKGRISDLLL